jgi:tyrosinase
MEGSAMDDHSSKGMDRRVFVKGVGWVSVGLVMGLFGGCESWLEQIRNRPIRRRLRTGSPEVDADIATYAAGVAAMKGLGAGDQRSWANQSAIHGVPGHFTFCQHSTDHFFDWHRGYLFYFEKIIQKLTGKPKWGLPYWNWNQNAPIHPAFLDPASPLFIARTRTTVAGLGAVSTAALDPIMADTSFFTLSQQIEGTPHNSVHGWVGMTMGQFYSPLDPIFWCHHNMVDYCWAKWNIDLGNNNTNDPAWVNHNNEHFFDADGNAASVTAGVTTLMPLLSYRFESSAIGSSAESAESQNAEDLKKVEQRIRQGANIRFEIKKRIAIAERAVMSLRRSLSLQTRANAGELAGATGEAGGDKVFVEIVYAKLPPASDFFVRVFINLPGANRDTPTTDPHFAGSFAFFGTEPAEPAPSDQHEHKPRFLVNATDALQRLNLPANEPVSVQLVPAPMGSDFERGDAELVIDQLQLIVTPVVIKSNR